jgi:copper homeostasis protein (lipoprotein)
MRLQSICLFLGILIIGLYSCKSKPAKKAADKIIYKGLYSFGPDLKSFKECDNGHEFWVADSSAQLELQYSQLNNKPDEAVYIEVRGKKLKTVKDGMGSDYDSTLVVTKLIKITKEIPKNGCN